MNSSCDGNLSRLASGNLIRFFAVSQKLLFSSVSFPSARHVKYFLSSRQTFRPRMGAVDKVPLSYYLHCLLSEASAELTGNRTRYSIVDGVIVLPFLLCNVDFPPSLSFPNESESKKIERTTDGGRERKTDGS